MRNQISTENYIRLNKKFMIETYLIEKRIEREELWLSCWLVGYEGKGRKMRETDDRLRDLCQSIIIAVGVALPIVLNGPEGTLFFSLIVCRAQKMRKNGRAPSSKSSLGAVNESILL